MTTTLHEAMLHYEETTLPSGLTSYDCGDKVAILLRGLDIKCVCRMADNVTNSEEGTHEKKYAHLKTVAGTPNNGAIRINCGNIIRSFLK
jgi:hypothetical protein